MIDLFSFTRWQHVYFILEVQQAMLLTLERRPMRQYEGHNTRLSRQRGTC